MKQNQNNLKQKDYYVGLDVGTQSVGWAVTSPEYDVLKFQGKSMWGARLFDEAETAEGRRTARTSRRRLARRNQRLVLLEELFAKEITKKDPNFFMRLHESGLVQEDRSNADDMNSLFNDPGFTDKDYAKKYPSVYHLRKDLIENPEEHDVRLVFLAIHHLMKLRGHFLYATSENDDGMSIEESLDQLSAYLADNGIDFHPQNKTAFLSAMMKKMGITDKKKALKDAYGTIEENEGDFVSVATLLDMLSGASTDLGKLFNDRKLKEAKEKIQLSDELDERFEELAPMLDEKLDCLLYAKAFFDLARLNTMLGGEKYLSFAKVAQYEANKKDLTIVRKWVKKNMPENYDEIFEAKEGVKNFAAYVQHKTDEKCSQEDCCKFLKAKLAAMESDEDGEVRRVYGLIKDNSFYPKLRGVINGLVPYQLNLKELKAILHNAEGYLPFLKDKDSKGLSVSDKLISLFTFRIPYYVGPLNKNSDRAWIERTDEKIYPWNFKDVVDEEKSAESFMENLVGRCTYTGDSVLPLNSLLYSEYMVLNAINPLKINGDPVPYEVKMSIYKDLFCNSRKKVTKKRIYSHLLKEGVIEKGDEISGVDDNLNVELKSYHDFERILEKTKDSEMVENIIERIVVFGEDKKMLRKWLVANTHDLDESDIRYILKINYKDWGRLSETFLTKLHYEDKTTGEMLNLIDLMRQESKTMMQIINEYHIVDMAARYKEEHYPAKLTLQDKMDELYISPKVKRSIHQTMRIVDEIVDIEKGAPKKIFIEMARPRSQDVKKERTESRKDKLLKLYKSCKGLSEDLVSHLNNETDQSLRRDKLYLYYLQFGKCMYSGEPIDLETAMAGNEVYDIDHIFPRSKIKDDSIDNRVLVKSTLNREKTNTYPIDEDIRKKMLPMWTMLHEKGLMSDKKYDRLKRGYPLTEEELSDFVVRQLVETQQATKALATILQDQYPNTTIVYSKAGNVSEFRQEFGVVKFRDINDLHHAKDAYLNIVVGNVYNTKFTEKFFKNIKSEDYSLKTVFKYPVPGAWVTKGWESIRKVRHFMAKNNPIVTFMPFKKTGQLYNLTILKKGTGQFETKSGKSIDKYGGYSDVAGTYFCVVEHAVKKKRVRTIEPVYLAKEKLFKEDPKKYCETELGLIDPVVTNESILMSSLLELDGKMLYVTGRTGNRLLFKHAYQFAVDEKHTKYFKNAERFLSRNLPESVEEDEIEKRYGISKVKNLEMYDWLIERLHSNVYYSLPLNNVANKMEQSREVFAGLSISNQCMVIFEVLKSFKCNREITDLKLLKGGKTGVVLYSKTISNFASAKLIHQSVTGLYEVKEDLLK